jgi:hypothetical protein
MSPICKSPNNLPVSVSSIGRAAVQTQKPSSDAGLRGKRAQASATQQADNSLNAGDGASRSETDEFAPLWHGPQLRPAFVAQLLGQVFPAGGGWDRRSTQAYRSAGSRVGMRCVRTA